MPKSKPMRNKYSINRNYVKKKKPENPFRIKSKKELERVENFVLGTGAEVIEKAESDDEQPVINEEDEREPAWVDEDDGIVFDEVVSLHGREKRCQTGKLGTEDYTKVVTKRYQRIMGVPNWAKKKQEEPDSELLKHGGNFIRKTKVLEKDRIEIKKLCDLNHETYAEGPIITTVQFHRTSTIALVAGKSGVASLFQVDGKQNTKLQSIKFDRFPINCGSFLRNNEEFIVGSQNYKYFYSHNLITGESKKINNSKIIDITKFSNFKVSPDGKLIAVCGNFGNIYLLSAVTKEYISCLKMNGDVNAVDFSSDGSKMYSHGDEGEVYIWDVNSRLCVHKFIDEGCLSGTSISVSPNEQFLACGSSSGVVNVYDVEKIRERNVQPIKTIYNLVTAVNCVKFNPTTEILSLSSDRKWNAVKLVQFPSMTAFSNFPMSHSKLHKPVCVDFSPNSGFYAIGDSKGNAHLFRLKYFGNY